MNESKSLSFSNLPGAPVLGTLRILRLELFASKSGPRHLKDSENVLEYQYSVVICRNTDTKCRPSLTIAAGDENIGQ